MNPNINAEIQVTLLPCHDGNRQSIWRSLRRSNESSKEGDSRVRSVKSYRQVKSPPSSPTDKSKAHVQVLPTSQKPTGDSLPRYVPTSLPRSRPWSLPRSRPRFYYSSLSRAQPCSRPDAHRSGLPTTITASSSIYKSMPSTDDYQLQHTECMWKHCTELRQR